MTNSVADEVKRAIRMHALRRLSEIFHVPLAALNPELRFGIDLRSSFVSDFRRNELDIVNDDIHDVADNEITKLLASELLVIRTVDEYCDHMIRCSISRQADVASLLKIHPPA